MVEKAACTIKATCQRPDFSILRVRFDEDSMPLIVRKHRSSGKLQGLQNLGRMCTRTLWSCVADYVHFVC